MEDQHRFLTQREELKPYMVEFIKDVAMNAKDYPVDCIVRGEKRHSIIVSTHDKYTFILNDRVQKALTREGDIFLRL